MLRRSIARCIDVWQFVFLCFLLDGASTFPRVLSPLASHCTPCFPCWMVCLPSRGSCFPSLAAFSRVLSPLVCYCFPTCVLVLDCVSLDGVFAFMRTYEDLSSLASIVSHCLPFSPSAFLFPIVSHCLPTCAPLFDGVLCPPP